MDAGLDVARINFSHGTHEQHAERIQVIRREAAVRGRPVAILGDLQGPRIRIGNLTHPIVVEAGHEIVLCPEDVCRAGEIPVTYEALASDVHDGDRILVDDGLIELVVMDVQKPRVVARVVYGGPIKSHKGLNLPGVAVSAPSITEKDKADVAFAIAHHVDYLALSFVRRADDISALRQMLPKGMLVVAKIEKDTALSHIESILRASDAVMVARGDLGVELPFEEVPLVQKRIIRLANQMGRPVITATQMLESMVQHPRPTRAEASDVANAILDGTDAVMLSAETAMGRTPAGGAGDAAHHHRVGAPSRPAAGRSPARLGDGVDGGDHRGRDGNGGAHARRAAGDRIYQKRVQRPDCRRATTRCADHGPD
jgi:pyruvate kinase